MNNNAEIKLYWDGQAKKHGTASQATMPDQYLKDLEIESLKKYLRDGIIVADVGCGNGYSTLQYASEYDLQIKGIDFSEQMINAANSALTELSLNIKQRVDFAVGDVRSTGENAERYDVVTTDRCLINLSTREDQASAIREMHRILKPNGVYLMCEDFESGLENLNRARRHMGLYDIETRWHNLYLDEGHMRTAIQGLFELTEVSNFSSFYYLASRIINAKIADDNGTEPCYDAEINKVAAQCSSMLNCGDFGPLKMWVLRKI